MKHRNSRKERIINTIIEDLRKDLQQDSRLVLLYLARRGLRQYSEEALIELFNVKKLSYASTPQIEDPLQKVEEILAEKSKNSKKRKEHK